VQKEKVQRLEKPTNFKATVPKHQLQGEDEYSDEGDLREILSDALDSDGVREGGWDEEQAYEQRPRSGDSQWRKKESTKLPMRTLNGKLQQIDASESESSDESSESDSDSVVDESPLQPVVEANVKTGPEAVIEAREALAKLAEEILESPEERCSHP
jgi:hypothetical protein